jgi:hypothetical protein
MDAPTARLVKINTSRMALTINAVQCISGSSVVRRLASRARRRADRNNGNSAINAAACWLVSVVDTYCSAGTSGTVFFLKRKRRAKHTIVTPACALTEGPAAKVGGQREGGQRDQRLTHSRP